MNFEHVVYFDNILYAISGQASRWVISLERTVKGKPCVLFTSYNVHTLWDILIILFSLYQVRYARKFVLCKNGCSPLLTVLSFLPSIFGWSCKITLAYYLSYLNTKVLKELILKKSANDNVSMKSYPACKELNLVLSQLLTFANSLDPDQARQNIGPDLDRNCLTLRWYSWKNFFRKSWFWTKISRRQKNMKNYPEY